MGSGVPKLVPVSSMRKGRAATVAVKSTAKAAENGATARVLFSAVDLAEPVRTIFANPHNLCYLNALIQALLWNSSRVCRPACLVETVACFRYHGAIASTKSVVTAARDLAQPSATARCCGTTRIPQETARIPSNGGKMGSPYDAKAPSQNPSECNPSAASHAAVPTTQNLAGVG